MAGITVTEERLEVMDFSDSYATGVQVVIVKEDSPIQTIDDLANAEMIGCQAATTGYIYASDTPENGGYGEDHVTAYDNGALAVHGSGERPDRRRHHRQRARQGLCGGQPRPEDPGRPTGSTEDYAIGVAKGNTASAGRCQRRSGRAEGRRHLAVHR